MIGAKVVDAEARLADQPLQARASSTGPAKPGETPGIVLAQDPGDGHAAALRPSAWSSRRRRRA